MRRLLSYPPLYIVIGVALAIVVREVREDFVWGTLALGGLIMLYAWLADKKDNAAITHVGDNCYLIGFVYTLAIIAIALGTAGIAGSAAGVSDISDSANQNSGALQNPLQLAALLQTVAIALSTSVIGMTLRFFLTHNIQSPQEEMDDYVHRVAVQLNSVESSVSQLNSVIFDLNAEVMEVKTAFQYAVEGARKHAQEWEAVSQNAGINIQAAAEGVMKQFANQMSEILSVERFDKVQSELHTIVQAHRQSITMITKILDEAFTKINIGTQSVGDMADSARASLNKISEVTLNDNWQQSVESLGQFTSRLEVLQKTLQNELTFAQDDLKKVEQVRHLFDQLVLDLQKDINQAVELKQQYREAYQTAAKDALAETHKLYAELLGGAQVALANLEELKDFSKDIKTIAAHLEADKKLKATKP